MRSVLSAVVLGLFVLVQGCSDQGGSPAPVSGAESSEPSRVATDVQGTWIGEREYQNKHFNVQLTIPTEWYFEKGMNEGAKDMGTDLLVGDDANKKKSIEVAMKNTETPFMAYRYPPGTPGKSNPNVICMVEKVQHLPGIRTGADYLLIMEQTLKGTNAQVTYLNDPEEVLLGGVEFWMRKSSLNLGFASVAQTVYTRKMEDYVLLISVTTLEEGDQEVVVELIDTISTIKEAAASTESPAE